MKMFLLLFVALFIRLSYLGVVPVSLSHDEIDNIIQSYSLKFTGHDISESWSPTSFLPNDGVMAELAPLINLPAISFLPSSIFTSHLTTAILSSLFPVVLIMLLLSLKVPSSVAWLTGWLIAISPWHIIFSRTSLEQPTSLFFYLLSWVFLVKLFHSSKSNFYYLSTTLAFVFSYAIGFFTYHGYKFALPILTIMIVVYLVYENKKTSIWKLFVVPTILVVGLLFRMVLNQDHYASRSSEIILTQIDKYAKNVDIDRRISLAPKSVDTIFSNKYLALFDRLKSKYLMTISPDLLYTSGEANGVFSVGRIGYIYLASLPFIIIGITYLLYHHNSLHLLLLGLLFVSPVASVVHINNSLAFRSGIYFVLLNIVIAYGLYASYLWTKSKILIYLIVACFVFGFSRFLYAYFFLHPTESASAYFFADRVLGQYLSHASNKSILVIDPQPRYILSNMILSKNQITARDLKYFGGSYSPSDLDIYHVNGIDIMRSCPNNSIKEYDSVIIAKVLVDGNYNCPQVTHLKQKSKQKDREIVSPLDSGTEKLIIGDSLCNELALGSYISPKEFSDYNIYAQDKVQFCHNWVVEQ